MIRWPVVAGWYGLCVLGAVASAGVIVALGSTTSIAGTVVLALTMFSPMLATVVTERVAPASAPLSWRLVPSRWLLVASALGLSIPILTLLVTPLVPGLRFDWAMQGLFDRYADLLTPEQVAEMRAQIAAMPVHPIVLLLPQAAIAGMTVNALFAFGEEIGWRGWLWRELRPLGFWRAAGLSGALWGLWHAPLILLGHNYPNERVPGVFLFTVVCVLLTPLHAHLRERGDTVWAAAVLHGTFNAAAGVAMMVVAGPELAVGVQGYAGLISLGIANLGLWAARRLR